MEIKKNSDTQTNLPKFFCIWSAGFAMKDGKSQVSSCLYSVLIFEIIVFFVFRRKYIQQLLSEELKVLSKSLIFSFCYLFVCIWSSCFFFKFFSRLFCIRFYPKLVETTTNSTNAKPLNFTRRTIENCFVPLVCSLKNFVF